jgi:hypothetical protein
MTTAAAAADAFNFQLVRVQIVVDNQRRVVVVVVDAGSRV